MILGNGKKVKIVTVIMIFLFMLLNLVFCVPRVWADDQDGSGYRANSLKVMVGYYGGPFYEKKVYSLDELQSMELEHRVYSFIDKMPAVCLDCAVGVRLESLIDDAGIDLGSVQRLHFYTNDKSGGYYVDFTKELIFDTPRYYYPKLADNYDAIDGAKAGAGAGAVRVPAILAISDHWVRYIDGRDNNGNRFVEDYSNQNTSDRFRLIFGQTSVNDSNASSSARWVNSINVVLSGAPTFTVKETSLKLKVGSKYTIKVNVNAADELLATEIAKNLKWSSSNEKIAKVDQEGNVTVVGNGKAQITASYNGTGVTVGINGGTVKKDDNKKDNNKKKDDEDKKKDDSKSDDNGDSDGDGGNGSDSGNGGDDSKSSSIKIGNGTDKTLKVDPSALKASGKSGGWISFEMPANSEKLPDIKTDNPLLPVTGAAAGVMLLGGAAGRVIKFKRDIR